MFASFRLFRLELEEIIKWKAKEDGRNQIIVIYDLSAQNEISFSGCKGFYKGISFLWLYSHVFNFRFSCFETLLSNDEAAGSRSCYSSGGSCSGTTSTGSCELVQGLELLHQEGASLLELGLLLLEFEVLLEAGNFKGVTTEGIENLNLPAEGIGELDSAVNIDELKTQIYNYKIYSIRNNVKLSNKNKINRRERIFFILKHFYKFNTKSIKL